MKLMSRRPLGGYLSLTAWFVTLCFAIPAGAQICAFPVDPISTGPLGRTNEPYPMFNFDHRYDHSGTHLQGVRAREKWAGGLVHTPAGTGFTPMTGVVIVNNPDPNLLMTATVDFFDPLGALVGTVVRVIRPEGFAAVSAAPLATTFGVGTARVTVSEDSPPLVGATLQHTPSFTVPLGGVPATFVDGDRPLSTNGNPPGASSMQQLQKPQDNGTRLQTVVPMSLISRVDKWVGNLPWLHVVNPNPTPNVIQLNLNVFDRTTGTVAGPILWRTVVLNGFGSLTDFTGPHLTALGTTNLGLFEALVPLYGTPGLDFDLIIDINSLNGLSIIGDSYMADLVGPTAPGGNAIRMTSTMMSTTPNRILTNPEFSYDRPTAGGIQQTLMVVANTGAVDAGPVTIQYFDNSNTLLSTFTVPNLPPNQTLRIEPGALGYPAAPATSGFGTARIIACQPIFGWSERETLPSNSVPAQYHKTYGEALLSLNGAEPGKGFAVAAQNPIRKVSPLVRVDSNNPAFQWPGYTVAANLATSNTGPYNWSFWNAGGTLCGFTPFNGLPFRFSSWTYEDPLTFCGGPFNMSGRFDITSGRVEGIDVLGDPFDEYGLPSFARETPTPTYEGPGDIVPTPDP